MAYAREKILAALSAFQEFTDLRDDPWEKASGVGEGTLRRLRNGKTRSLQSETYDRLAAGASQLKGQQFTAAHIRGEIALSSPVVPAANDSGREPKADYPQTTVTYSSVAPGRPDIPVWASAAAGDEGAMILVPDPIDYLRRSERMLSVRNPFAFNVLGDSMDPAIEHGDQVIINPSIVARAGQNCVFISEGSEGMHALVKRLLRMRPDQWQVRQFNPPRDFDISRRKWARVHPVAEIRKAGVG